MANGINERRRPFFFIVVISGENTFKTIKEDGFKKIK